MTTANFPTIDIKQEQPSLRRGKFEIDISNVNELKMPRYAVEFNGKKQYLSANDLPNSPAFSRVKSGERIEEGDIIVFRSYKVEGETKKLQSSYADIVVQSKYVGEKLVSLLGRGVHSNGVSNRERLQYLRNANAAGDRYINEQFNDGRGSTYHEIIVLRERAAKESKPMLPTTKAPAKPKQQQTQAAKQPVAKTPDPNEVAAEKQLSSLTATVEAYPKAVAMLRKSHNASHPEKNEFRGKIERTVFRKGDYEKAMEGWNQREAALSSLEKDVAKATAKGGTIERYNQLPREHQKAALNWQTKELERVKVKFEETSKVIDQAAPKRRSWWPF